MASVPQINVQGRRSFLEKRKNVLEFSVPSKIRSLGTVASTYNGRDPNVTTELEYSQGISFRPQSSC